MDYTFTTFWSETQALLTTKLFTVGQTPVTIASICVFAFLFIGLVAASRFVSQAISTRVLTKLNVNEATRYTIKRVVFYLLSSISAIFSFQFIGIDLGGLAVIFGLLSVGIGFGLQNITSNFISGLILLFERPIKVGDRITVNGTVGDVVAINMRSTTVRSLQNISIIVPNSDFIASQVINWSHNDPKTRLDLEIGVSYNSDLDSVTAALEQVAKEHPQVIKHPKPEVRLNSFGDSAWNMALLVWIRNPKHQFKVRSDLNRRIVKEFRQRSIEMPFPQQDVWFRNVPPKAITVQQPEKATKQNHLETEEEIHVS